MPIQVSTENSEMQSCTSEAVEKTESIADPSTIVSTRAENMVQIGNIALEPSTSQQYDQINLSKNVSSSKKLTPKCQLKRKKISALRIKNLRSSRKCEAIAKKYKQLKLQKDSISIKNVIQKASKHMNSVAVDFINTQLKMAQVSIFIRQTSYT